jgi:AraC-like DNA-binding protein
MAEVMKDHLYILERGHLFTTPCVAARLSLRFYVTIAVSAAAAPVKIDSGDQVHQGPALVFRPSQPRFVQGRDMHLVAALVNPLHPDFPRFRQIAAPGVAMLEAEHFRALQPELGRAYRGELDMLGAMQLHEQLVHHAAQAMPLTAPIDPRVIVAAARARADPQLSHIALARELDLSPSRLSHLFSSNMGLPFRAYLLWAKVHRTATLLAQGISLTEVTHQAGFADQAHMRRVFHELFGAPPSHFLRNDNVSVRLGRI